MSTTIASSAWARLLPFGTGVIIIIVWQLLASSAHSYFFPAPSAIAVTMSQDW